MLRRRHASARPSLEADHSHEAEVRLHVPLLVTAVRHPGHDMQGILQLGPVSDERQLKDLARIKKKKRLTGASNWQLQQ